MKINYSKIKLFIFNL